MIRLGLKLTHDGGAALLDGTTLVLSHEAEKSANLPRHAPLHAIDLSETLAAYGCSLGDVDRVLVDGWTDAAAPLGDGAAPATLPVAPYHETAAHPDPLAPVVGEGVPLPGGRRPFRSYTHVAGHACAAYATSPWAAERLPALVLVWDGAMLPRLYLLDPARPALRPLRPLFGLTGHVYPVVASHFGPFVPGGGRPRHDALPLETLLGLSGRAMAWAGLGRVEPELVALFARVYGETRELSWEAVFAFARAAHAGVEALGARHEDALASFQRFLAGKLTDALARVLGRDPRLPRRLCFTGGCALNIVWNAELRACGLFEGVWVPPFPNDAGSALGCAAADLLRDGHGTAIDWDVYRGPPLTSPRPAPGWSAAACDVPALARLLHETGEPVVLLHGRAELGPRALGNRSIVASAVRAETRDALNRAKLRDWYRPVAPICLAGEAPRVFDPGGEDPYMLFTHRVRADWRERVPAVVHVDGSARLQTVDAAQNPLVAQLLSAYRDLSGIPLLCNTSANRKGAGFFPDVRSATAWGGVGRVWSDGVLYTRD